MARKSYSDVLIGTPVRDGRFHTGYVVGLMHSTPLHNGWFPYSGQSDIYIARNVVINAFYQQKKYNTMVCIDSDIGFTHDDLKKIINSKAPVVSGIYPDRCQPPAPFCRDEIGNQMETKNIPPEGMIKSLLVPGGFLKLEREAVEAMVQQKIVRAYGKPSDPLYAFYETRYFTEPTIEPGETEPYTLMVSEDYSLAIALNQAGVQCWTNCGIRLTHDGRNWDGSPTDGTIKDSITSDPADNLYTDL